MKGKREWERGGIAGGEGGGGGGGSGRELGGRRRGRGDRMSDWSTGPSRWRGEECDTQQLLLCYHFYLFYLFMYLFIYLFIHSFIHFF